MIASSSHVQNGFQVGCAGFSILLNSLLIFLILKHSPKGLGPYKYLLIYTSVFELFYSVVDVIVSPVECKFTIRRSRKFQVLHSYGSLFMVFIDLNHSVFDRKTGLFGIAVYCGFFGWSLAIFSVHFIYRYLVATGSSRLATFKSWKLSIWLSAPVGTGVIWGSIVCILIGQKKAVGDYIRDKIEETFNLELADIVYCGVYFYQYQPDGSYKLDEESFGAMTFVFSIVGISFFTIIYFGVRCYLHIAALVPSNSKYRSRTLQSHLFWALCTQTIIPVVLMHIPFTFAFGFALMDKDIGMLSGILSITIAAYPAIDPIPNLLIVPHYRAALIYYFKCCRVPKEISQVQERRDPVANHVKMVPTVL